MKLKNIIVWGGLALLGFLFFSSGTSQAQSLAMSYKTIIEKSLGSLSDNALGYIYNIIQSFNINGDGDINKLSYIIATAYYESRGFRSLEEIRAAPGTDLYNKQTVYWNTGYYGRGLVQITHKENYKKMSDILGVDLVNNPDLAKDPKIAADIIVIGMMNGVFTGVGLSDFINDNERDFYNARQTVNGLDQAQLIENYADVINSNINTV